MLLNDKLSVCYNCEHREQDCSGDCKCMLSHNGIMEHVIKDTCPADKFHQITIENKKPVTFKQAYTFAKALVMGKRVALEIIQERNEICKRCDYIRQTKSGEIYCGECGCDVLSDDQAIKNLAAYEEHLPSWGCKHPKRSEGFGWKR